MRSVKGPGSLTIMLQQRCPNVRKEVWWDLIQARRNQEANHNDEEQEDAKVSRNLFDLFF